jgi:hypothetical protein
MKTHEEGLTFCRERLFFSADGQTSNKTDKAHEAISWGALGNLRFAIEGPLYRNGRLGDLEEFHLSIIWNYLLLLRE